MPKAKRNAEATRAAILDAAEVIFAEQGFAGASAMTIAKHAQVTKSLIHHYFGSKEQLWDEVKRRRYAEYLQMQAGVLSLPIRTREETEHMLRTSVSMLFRFLAGHPNLVRILSWMQLEDPKLDAPLSDLPAKGVEVLRAAQQAGHLRADVDPRHMVAAAFGLVEHWFQAKSRNRTRLGADLGEQADDDAYLSEVLEIYLRGVLR